MGVRNLHHYEIRQIEAFESVSWTSGEISSEVIGDNSDSPSSDFFIIYKDLVEAKDRSFWFEAAYDFIQLLCYSE